MLALYLVTASLAAALCGVYARTLLASMGLITGIEAGSLLIGGVACAFLVTQCAWVGFLRLLNPTRSTAFYISESLSHMAALALVPYLLHLEVEWPHPMLRHAEPLVYLGAFGGLHGLFKLAAFYASFGGYRTRLWIPLPWFTVALLFAGLAGAGLTGWLREAEAERPQIAEELQTRRAGDAYAQARRLPEGAVFSAPTRFEEGRTMTLRWATGLAPDASAESSQRIHVTVQVDGAEKKLYAGSVRMSSEGWSEMRLPASLIPESAETCTIRWTSRPQPNWQNMLGINPVIYTPPREENGPLGAPRAVWMAGPEYHLSRPPAVSLNFIVLFVDGLSLRHFSSNGYRRDTTPNLDRFLRQGTVFYNASSPEPGPHNAALALLSGGASFDSGTSPPLLRGLRQDKQYAVAAFTEGEDFGDPAAWSRACEVYDPSHSTGDDGGVHRTMEKVRAWAEDHQGAPFFVFARTTELAAPRERLAYDLSFLPRGRSPRPIDVYDAALRHFDNEVGALLKTLRDRKLHLNTCLVVTAPYSKSFGPDGRPQRAAGRANDAGRIPILMAIPGQLSSSRKDPVTLADLGVTLAALANQRMDDATGRNLLLK